MCYVPFSSRLVLCALESADHCESLGQRFAELVNLKAPERFVEIATPKYRPGLLFRLLPSSLFLNLPSLLLLSARLPLRVYSMSSSSSAYYSHYDSPYSSPDFPSLSLLCLPLLCRRHLVIRILIILAIRPLLP